MNDLTTQPPSQFSGSPESALTIELAKMLGLVAPVTMSADQQTLWLASAVDALQGIRAAEVRDVSAEVRRSVMRHNQIVPEVAKLVAERRARQSRLREYVQPALEGPPVRRPVMERRGETMSEEDTTELNGILERLGATARYRADGTRYLLSPGSKRASAETEGLGSREPDQRQKTQQDQ